MATYAFRLINANDCGWWMLESSAWPNHRKFARRKFSFLISTRICCCIDTRFPRSNTLSSRSMLIRWEKKKRFDWLRSFHSVCQSISDFQVLDVRDPAPGICAYTKAYIADVAGFSLLVYDSASDSSWRVQNSTYDWCVDGFAWRFLWASWTL